jgi:dihydrofolate reductase
MDRKVAAGGRRLAQGTNALVFGRVTYEVMVAWWPTPAAGRDRNIVFQAGGDQICRPGIAKQVHNITR